MSRTIVLSALWYAVILGSSASAGVVNGGFETGLGGWTLTGSGKSADATVGVSPTEGSRQGYIETTGNFTATAPIVMGALGITGPTILGLGAGVPTVGTGLTQSLTVSAGDTLSFDWNFMTDELNETATFNDFGFYTIDGAAFLLASRNSSTYDISSPPAGFDGQTGWSTETYTFASAGTYTLGFGVFNVGDSGHNSVLLLDAVSLPVPEPTSSVLLAMGAVAWGGLGVRRRRRSRQACQ